MSSADVAQPSIGPAERRPNKVNPKELRYFVSILAAKVLGNGYLAA